MSKKNYNFNGKLLNLEDIAVNDLKIEVIKTNPLDSSFVEKSLKSDIKINSDGTFSIDLQDNFDKNAVVIKVLDKEGKEVFRNVHNDVQERNKVEIEIDHNLLPKPSQITAFSKIEKAVDGFELKDVNDKALVFLSDKTKFVKRDLKNLIEAKKLESKNGIPSELNFAMLAYVEPTALYAVNFKTVEKIWAKAMEEEIISSYSEDEVNSYLNIFKEKNIEFLLSDDNKIGISSLGEVLSLSSMTTIEAQKDFLKNSQEENFELNDDLKKINKLGVLTQYNVPLMKEVKLLSKKELTLKGYFRKDKWLELKLFKDNKIKIPENMEKEEYAQLMALALKLEYPNEAMAVELTAKKVIDKKISMLMIDKGFKLGEESLNAFESRVGIIDDLKVKKNIKKVHRQLAISPSIEMMPILDKLGIDSAHKIQKMSEKQLNILGIDNSIDKLSKEERKLFLQKSKVIKSNADKINKSNTFLLISDMMYKVQPSIPTILPSFDPTLKNLVGELDLCHCGHCSSVLSPAAYMVELLKFLDTDKNDDGKTAQDILLEKRPDLEYLELTCENTETILPYIDVVNEILEYYADNITIYDYKGHNSSTDKELEIVQHKNRSTESTD